VGPEDAPAFYVDGGIHPDEWAPSYGMLAYIARLAKDYEAHLPWATALLRRQRLLCLPLLHPDSWEHHTRLRHGIDLNRNFPVGWNDNTSSRKGPAPLSEPEARTVAELFAREKPFAAVSWHETSANTNWVGCPRFTANYRKYALSCPEIFRQLIDRDHFFWQQALWTQPHDERNYHYHYVESFPYLRHYKDVSPFELHYADSLGIEAILVEQVGNGDLGPFSTPQRTDLTARILEMLLGLQVGLVCRNCSGQNKRVSIPAATAGPAEAIVYAPDGSALDKHPLRVQDGAAVAEAILPPGSCLVVETP
jgi:hypothetical protein